jgi:peroxiredoxin
MKKIQILALTAGYVLAFGYYGCKKNETPAVEKTVQAETPEAAGAYTRKNTYFKLPDYKGGDIELSAYAGKPVMLMFFTEHCPFCRKAAPFIEGMNRQFSTKGLNVIGISLDEGSSSAAGFARDFKLSFPLAYKGRDAARRYNAQGVPFIYLLDKSHAIHRVWAGYDPEFDGAIQRGIEEIIK